jgi:predicted site-specific integrase-resolvase
VTDLTGFLLARIAEDEAVARSDAQTLALELGIPAGTIRRWAHAGWITRRGRDRRGRTLYDYDEVVAVAQRVGRRAVDA